MQEEHEGDTPSDLIDAKIRALGGWRGEMLGHLRNLIRQAEGDVIEDVKWRKPTNPAGVPVWSHAGILCAGETYRDKVKLTFAKGAALGEDPLAFRHRFGSVSLGWELFIMRLAISTALDTSAEKAWAEVQTSRLLDHIAWPLLTFKPISSYRLPAVWEEGVHRVHLRLLGVVLLVKQSIVTTKPTLGPNRYQLRDNGSGDLVSRWDHMITIEPLGPDQCQYTDEVDVQAAILTPFVWSFAVLFYAYRQSRWRSLVARKFAY